MHHDSTAATLTRGAADLTDDAAETVLKLAERTGPDAPLAVREALATLAVSLGDPAGEDIRAGRLGWDAEDGPIAERIAWT